MAEFDGGKVVVVPMPATPDMVVWALPGPTGDIPYQDVENLVEAEFDDRIDRMEALESDTEGHASDAEASAGESEDFATLAQGFAQDSERSRDDAHLSAVDAAGSASAAAGSAGDAEGAASTASGHAGRAADSEEAARTYAEEFDLTVSSETGAPGTQASVTVTGEGPAYSLAFDIPKGDPGEQGPPGEVTQAALDSAVASLVDGAPEALNTLDELADALGGDPNFATTVSEAIGKRAKIDGAPAEYDSLGKLVAALLAGDLGGSTDASELTGALTDAVDASAALFDLPMIFPEAGPMDLTAALVAFAGLMGDTVAEKGHTHTPAEVGLGNVDNTADADKPVSTATQAALDAKVQLVSEFPSSPESGVLYLKAED